jgi:hypothetical protein
LNSVTSPKAVAGDWIRTEAVMCPKYSLKPIENNLEFYLEGRKKMPYVQKKCGALFAGLPDGLFLYQKFKFGKILEGLGKEHVST